MKKALHIYAVNGKANSGDFFLGPATKFRFEKIVGESITWSNFDVRIKVTEKEISHFNKFDYIVLGGGGLFLPDTNPNMTSCWQWACPAEIMKKITTEVHIVSVGWNHFYGQDITMPDRGSNKSNPKRLQIFKNNIETLLQISQSFTMRHKGDVEELKKIIDPELHDKVQFAFCPVVEFIESKYKKDFKSGELIAFEIKDDRPNRRYYKKSRKEFYLELLQFIKHLIDSGEKIAVMSHDGSASFARFLQSQKIPFAYLNNTVANQDKIIENYSKVKKLFCTAGHSQMTAYALGLNFYSLITHDKLKFFLEDNNMLLENNFCLVNEQKLTEKYK
tara:strand:- start:55223 stop:56221 length:999 start_codon:yes stop_codon:yes gene_type:complete